MASERFSKLSAIHEGKMRIISGITGLNLQREGRSEEATTYLQSFVKLKDFPLECLSLARTDPRFPTEKADLKSGSRLLEIASTVSKGNLSTDDMRKYAKELAGILNEARANR